MAVPRRTISVLKAYGPRLTAFIRMPSLSLSERASPKKDSSEVHSGLIFDRLLLKSSALSLGRMDSIRCEVAVGRSFTKAQSGFLPGMPAALGLPRKRQIAP